MHTDTHTHNDSYNVYKKYDISTPCSIETYSFRIIDHFCTDKR